MSAHVPDVVGVIPGRLEKIFYRREAGRGDYPDGSPRTGPYQHAVTTPTDTFTLSDGSLLHRARDRRTRLWVDIPDPGHPHPTFERRPLMDLWYDNPRKRRRRHNPGLAAYLNRRRHHNPRFDVKGITNEVTHVMVNGAIGGVGAATVLLGANAAGNTFYPDYYTGVTIGPKLVRAGTRAGLAFVLNHVVGRNFRWGPVFGVGAGLVVGIATVLDFAGTSLTLGAGDDQQTIQSLLESVSMPALNGAAGLGARRRIRVLNGVGTTGVVLDRRLSGVGEVGAIMRAREVGALGRTGSDRLFRSPILPS